jgi:membrane protein YqaA with SNARE-associated domain
MNDEISLGLLFFSAFTASTILPGGSELVLVGVDLGSGNSLLLILLVATAGNALGGMTSWLLGRGIAIYYPADDIRKSKFQQALKHLQRWGDRVLLFSWLPVIGDPLCVAAGWMKLHWLRCLFYITLGKCARYLVILVVLRQF